MPASVAGPDDDLFEALILEPAGAGSWRICDARLRCGDGRFLAFVDEKNDQFEVMQIADDFVWTSFPTMADALAHVAQTTGRSTYAAPADELGWTS